jgi:hypothetical protein
MRISYFRKTFPKCSGVTVNNCPSLIHAIFFPKISTVKYGMINAPEIKEVLCDLIKIKIETNKFLETNLKISSSS